MGNSKRSGHNSSGHELDLEIKQKFIKLPNNERDFLTYYCYLEWKDDIKTDGWLTGLDQSIDLTYELSSPSPSKKNKFEDNFAILVENLTTPEVNNNDQSKEVNELVLQKNKLDIEESKLRLEQTTLNNINLMEDLMKKTTNTELQAKLKRRYDELIDQI